MLRILAIGTALLMVGGTAVAGERAGVRMPDTLQVGQRELVLNGLGVREATAFKVDVYVAGLYLERRSKSAQQILGADDAKLLHLKFKRDVDREDVVAAFSDGFENNAGNQVAALEPRIRKLEGWVPSFREGDTLTLLYLPGQGTTVSINDKPVGTIEGADFGRALFSIWLGPKPPNAGLKRGLLGR